MRTATHVHSDHKPVYSSFQVEVFEYKDSTENFKAFEIGIDRVRFVSTVLTVSTILYT